MLQNKSLSNSCDFFFNDFNMLQRDNLYNLFSLSLTYLVRIYYNDLICSKTLSIEVLMPVVGFFTNKNDGGALGTPPEQDGRLFLCHPCDLGVNLGVGHVLDETRLDCRLRLLDHELDPDRVSSLTVLDLEEFGLLLEEISHPLFLLRLLDGRQLLFRRGLGRNLRRSRLYLYLIFLRHFKSSHKIWLSIKYHIQYMISDDENIITCLFWTIKRLLSHIINMLHGVPEYVTISIGYKPGNCPCFECGRTSLKRVLKNLEPQLSTRYRKEK